jgi:hypothetical protein
MVTPDLVSEEDIAKLIIPDDLPDEQPTFKAYIEAKVYDKEGRLIQHHRQPTRSLTQYFLGIIAVLVIGTYQNATTYNAPGILVNLLGLPSQQSTVSGNGANIVWDWAIQLGSGTQSFSLTLTSLEAPIASGTATGQLLYGTKSVSYAGSSIYISLQVTNATSSAVTVTEIGLQGTIYVQYQQSISGASAYTNTTYRFLLSYDTFSTPVTVPAYGMAVFQITLSFTG